MAKGVGEKTSYLQDSQPPPPHKEWLSKVRSGEQLLVYSKHTHVQFFMAPFLFPKKTRRFFSVENISELKFVQFFLFLARIRHPFSLILCTLKFKQLFSSSCKQRLSFFNPYKIIPFLCLCEFFHAKIERNFLKQFLFLFISP